MTKLLITEITYMGPAFCVIGLVREGPTIYSLRPVPPRGNRWVSFPFHRGDILECRLTKLPCSRPHTEDHVSTRGWKKVGDVPQPEVVKYLRRAEVGDSLGDLFSCVVKSICGCATVNLVLENVGAELRATLALQSGETLRDLPVVDRDWNDFVEAATDVRRGANRYQRLAKFLGGQFQKKVVDCPYHFVRLGLTRPFKRRCWLMLDTLFPLPQMAWLQEF